MTSANESVASGHNQEPVLRAFEYIRGDEIERRLLDLASIGGTQLPGTPEQPERYSVNRLALSPIDIEARATFIAPLMEQAGMSVQEHPFGLIGTLEGEKPELPPLVIFSHTDSVPKADMYDGVTGVIGGITAVEAITASGITPERNIHVVALTGEESSAFGFALFGSRGMWHGLTEAELDASIPGGKSIRETLGDEATEIVRHPVVGEGGIIPNPHAVIELHVEQNDSLDKAGIDLGVVEAIAAPVRHNVKFGDSPIEIDLSKTAHSATLKLLVNGSSDHSGATPMGVENRADGLVETARLLLDMLEGETDTTKIDIGSMEIDEQALNKIPGLTSTEVRIRAESDHDLEQIMIKIESAIGKRNKQLGRLGSKFGADPIVVEVIDEEYAKGKYFTKNDVAERQMAALEFIVNVNEVATQYSRNNVVGTVGTVHMSSDGIISLGLDIRGIDETSRSRAIADIKYDAIHAADIDSAQFGDPLPGSGNPVVLDSSLVRLAKEKIDEFEIGSSQVMFSAAGHDAQNSAKAGHPTVMIFCQSNAGGIAHHPDAYTNTDNLEKGVKALTALTLSLV